MSTPGYVVHEGKRRLVVRAEDYDNEPGFWLRVGHATMWAREADCQPYVPSGARRRVLRAEDVVLEFAGGRALSVRRARARRRYTITFGQIFDCAAKIAARVELAKKRAERQAKGRR